MPITLASNISSLRVERQLARNSGELGKTFERLSSGLRINRASDDAAGLAVSSLLSTDRRVFSQGVRNLNDGLSILAVAEGAIGQLSNIVIRQRELAEQAANGIFSGAQRVALNREAQSLAAEYQRILDTTEFNGRGLLNGSNPSVSIQAGYGAEGNIDADILENYEEETFLNQGLGTYTNHVESFLSPNGTLEVGPRLIVADMNLDGIDDIVAATIRDQTATNQVVITAAVFLGDEDGNFALSAQQQASLSSPYLGSVVGFGVLQLQLSDIGNDGDLDIRFNFNFTSNPPLLGSVVQGHFTNNIDSGTFSVSYGGAGQGATVNQSTNTVNGDFNNDGIQDIATAAGPDVNIRIQDTTQVSQGINIVAEDLSQASFNLLNQTNALSALDQLEDNLTQLSKAISRIGASQSRVGTAANVLSTTTENVALAESQIKDADIAFESAKFVRLQLLQQASAAILSQANAQPQLALTLLGNI
ncbi:MAG: VCBS repeat-containing protein [Bdellovibrionales bacterium]|nr:VCBS repeat-containing protein [Bdellovibrionales bacterium]